MSHILSVDPGSNASGFCLLKRQGPRVRYMTGGKVDSTPKGIADLFCRVAELLAPDDDDFTLAIECVQGVFSAKTAMPIVATAEAVGLFMFKAWESDIQVIRHTAGEVRKALVGKASSPKKGLMDKLISDAVRANVIGFGESNVHVRDAAALGVIANWELCTRRVV